MPPPPPEERDGGPPAAMPRLYGVDTPALPPDAKPGFRRAGEPKEGRRQKTEEQERRRYRPKSAPALRRNVTPLHIPIPTQVIRQGERPRGTRSAPLNAEWVEV